MARFVKVHTADVHDAHALLHGAHLLGGAAQQGVDARQELADAEGLGEVVVSAQLEAHDLVEFGVPCREEEDGDVGAAADAAADLVAVDAGEHDVQDHEVVLGGLGHGDGLVAAVRDVDLVALLQEVEADDVCDAFLIVNHENALLVEFFHGGLLPGAVPRLSALPSLCHARGLAQRLCYRAAAIMGYHRAHMHPSRPSGRNPMLLAVDIGNTQTTAGLFEGSQMRVRWAVTTRAADTPDELHQTLFTQLALSGLELACIDDAVIASVVPALTSTWAQVAERVSGQRPVVVGPGVKSGLPMHYDNPAEVGADRVADAVAAVALYGAPVVVVDLGTATNIEVIDETGAFRGGIIAPGLRSGADSLFKRGALLSQVGLSMPDHVIGTNTADAMRSGIMLGEVARIDGLVQRIFEELGYEAPVIASGGVGKLEHFAEGIIDGEADAVLAASVFHFGELSVRQVKEYMAAQGIPVRL